RVTLTEAGAYTIRVNAANLVSTGSYNIGLECILPRGPVDGTLSCGGLVSGSISAPGEVDLLGLTGQPNAMVLLTLANTGSFPFTQPLVTVVAPSGTDVVSFTANNQRQITLTESGAYTILVNANNLV